VRHTLVSVCLYDRDTRSTRSICTVLVLSMFSYTKVACSFKKLVLQQAYGCYVRKETANWSSAKRGVPHHVGGNSHLTSFPQQAAGKHVVRSHSNIHGAKETSYTYILVYEDLVRPTAVPDCLLKHDLTCVLA
jgi:hypothetical protein